MYEAEVDYIRDLATRWQSYSYVAAGVGLVLGIIAASMRGYVVHGVAMVSGAIAYTLAAAIMGTGFTLCGVLQVVARRLFGDIDAARVDAIEAEAVAQVVKTYVYLDVPGDDRYVVQKSVWDRIGLPLGELPVLLEVTPGGRVVLAVNGTPVYG
jgi:hypothetical protein